MVILTAASNGIELITRNGYLRLPPFIRRGLAYVSGRGRAWPRRPSGRERLGTGNVEASWSCSPRTGEDLTPPRPCTPGIVDGRIVRWHLYGDTGRVEDAWLDR